MVKRKDRRDASCDSSLSAASMPALTTATITTTTSKTMASLPTPTSPVQIQIPKHGIHAQRYHHHQHQHQHLPRRTNSLAASRKRIPPHVHSPGSLSPSVAALLAVTDIPRPRQSRRKARKADKPDADADADADAVDDIVSDEKELKDLLEKELSLTFGRASPMDMLLLPPDSLDDDDGSSDSIRFGCSMTRTLSADSMPSLGDSLNGTDIVSSAGSPRSQSPTPARRRMMSPMRKSLEPIRSPPDSTDEHPLAPSIHDLDDLDFVTVEKPEQEEEEEEEEQEAAAAAAVIAASSSPFTPFKAAFRSNLTASLRVLRSAARSFSSINFPSIPPDELVTRSLLTVDPEVPFTDERRPPVTEEMPSAELRRYLNPTTRLSLAAQPGSLQQKPKFSASIQMQTYKIQRSRPTSSSRGPFASASSLSSSASSSSSSSTAQSKESSADTSASLLVPGMRQREVRENPDFIRIAVMEMAMRRRGKLDSSKPGRARWALPPRKTPTKAYEIGADGVPVRWIPLAC